MCDCVVSALFPVSGIGVRFVVNGLGSVFKRVSENRHFYGVYGLMDGSGAVKARFCRHVYASASRNLDGLGFEEFDEGLGIDEKVEGRLRLERSRSELEHEKMRVKSDDGYEDGFKEVGEVLEELASSGVEFLERSGGVLKEKNVRSRKKGKFKRDDLVWIEDAESDKEERLVEFEGKQRLHGGRNVVKRSSLLAKQVITIQSALSLGFVSQLWVDTSTWVVQVVEVRPSLLSGESNRFFLKDVSRVGDVVLVRDESVMDTEMQFMGLETLVGYEVVTAGRRKVGKVRGYSFDINSGVVQTLELDSFGISIIPSSLVSTYVLLAADVLEVLPDRVVVHEAAASRMQRLTKGIWGARSVQGVSGVGADYSDADEDSDKETLLSEPDRATRKSSIRQRQHAKINDKEENWELPIDYL